MNCQKKALIYAENTTKKGQTMKKFIDITITTLTILFLIFAVCSSLLSFVNQYEMRQLMNEHDEEPEIFNKTWECREQKDGDMICFKIKG